MKCHLHLSWRPQSLGKVEQDNRTQNKTLGKLSGNVRAVVSPAANSLPRVRAAPETTTKLSPCKMTHRRPFLTLDMLTDPETQAHLRYIINLGQVQKAIQDYGNWVQPALDDSPRYPVVNPKRPQKMSPWWPASLNMEGFLPVFLNTPTAVKLQDVTSWVHLSRIKPVSSDMLQEPEDPHSSHPCESTPFSKSPKDQGHPEQTENSRWMSEPLQDLKLLFRRDKKSS